MKNFKIEYSVNGSLHDGDTFYCKAADAYHAFRKLLQRDYFGEDREITSVTIEIDNDPDED